MNSEQIKQSVQEIIKAIGEDSEREGLAKTPERITEFYQDIFKGINQKLPQDVKLYQSEQNDLIMIEKLKFYSMCEHHFLPIEGEIDLAYQPNENNQVLGLGTINRIIEIYTHRPQIQERLTKQIIDGIKEVSKARGVIARVRARHFCMIMRGEKDPTLTTIASNGLFETDQSKREEFFNLLN